MLTWPAFKACEPHVVLIALTGLALLALAAPEAWLTAWRWGVRGMAVLAPTLAVARMAKVVMRGEVEAEFARWFRPIDEDETGRTIGL